MKITSATFCAALTATLMVSPLNAAFSSEILPCAVRLVFKEASQGTDVVYLLSMQYKNRTARPISAVSTLLMSGTSNVVGNAQADCTYDGEPLNAGDTGECSWPIQVVGAKLMSSYGSAAWTDIVNDKLEKFQTIVQCDIVGHRYSNQPVQKKHEKLSSFQSKNVIELKKRGGKTTSFYNLEYLEKV